MKYLLLLALFGCGSPPAEIPSASPDFDITGTWIGYGLGSFYEIDFSMSGQDRSMVGYYYDDNNDTILEKGGWSIDNEIVTIDVFATNKLYSQPIVVYDNQLVIAGYTRAN